VKDFVAAWNKVMNLDRYDVPELGDGERGAGLRPLLISARWAQAEESKTSLCETRAAATLDRDGGLHRAWNQRTIADPGSRAVLRHCHNDKLKTASISFQSLDPPARAAMQRFGKKLCAN